MTGDQLVAAGLPRGLLFEDTPLARHVWTRVLHDDFDGEFPERMATRQPLQADTAANYLSQIRAFETWCAENGSSDIAAMDHDRRAAFVEGWLAGRAGTAAANTLTGNRRALQWWAAQHGHPDPVTEAAAGIRGQGEGRGPAVPPGTDEFNRILQALDAGEVVVARNVLTELGCQAWHLREKAAITVAVACSLRSQSELPHIGDDCVTHINEDGISLMLPKSKMKEKPQLLKLWYRGDNACPVSALYDWLAFCEQHQIPRHGALLPAVFRERKPSNMMSPRPSRGWEAKQWKLIAEHVGLNPKATLHGLRAMLPTEAAKVGWDMLQIRNLGRWIRMQTAAGYVRTTPTPLDLIGDVSS